MTPTKHTKKTSDLEALAVILHRLVADFVLGHSVQFEAFAIQAQKGIFDTETATRIMASYLASSIRLYDFKDKLPRRIEGAEKGIMASHAEICFALASMHENLRDFVGDKEFQGAKTAFVLFEKRLKGDKVLQNAVQLLQEKKPKKNVNDVSSLIYR